MKMKHRLILAATLSAGLLAPGLFADDQPGSAPASANPSGTGSEAPAPPAKKKKAAAAKKASATTKKGAPAVEATKAPVALTTGSAVVTQKNVNVRGQAAINSEIIVHLKKGDHVNVLEEVTLKKPKTDEPAKWAKVSLPTNAAVWVNASFVNAADKTVVPKKLNVRSGPGENYSVVARLAKGTVVKEIESKGDWMKIEAPADSYGFIAAHLLSGEPAAPPPLIVAAVEPPKPPPTETAVAPPITPAPAADPVVPPVTTPVPPVPPVAPAVPPPAAVTTPPEPAAPAPAPEEILVKRVVSREGFVKRSVSIQSPTYFALQSLDTGKTI